MFKRQDIMMENGIQIIWISMNGNDIKHGPPNNMIILMNRLILMKLKHLLDIRKNLEQCKEVPQMFQMISTENMLGPMNSMINQILPLILMKLQTLLVIRLLLVLCNFQHQMLLMITIESTLGPMTNMMYQTLLLILTKLQIQLDIKQLLELVKKALFHKDNTDLLCRKRHPKKTNKEIMKNIMVECIHMLSCKIKLIHILGLQEI